jgi:LysM repeat protein
LVIISTIVVALVLLLPSAFGATPGGSTEDYVVRSGDTLWDIAKERTTEGQDVRGTITSIRRLNDLESSIIQPGETLAVPPLASSN